jgi:hypothetical protein
VQAYPRNLPQCDSLNATRARELSEVARARRTETTSTKNKHIVRRLYEEVWNERKLDVVDELISRNHALHTSTDSYCYAIK